MEYHVGSLADMISGSSSLKKQKRSKKISESSGTTVKFEKVTHVVTKKSPERKRKKADGGTPVTPQKKRLRFSEPLETDANEVGFKDVNLKKIQNTEKIKHVLDPEEESRTIFVGNVPKTVKTNFLKRLFVEYGNIESVRFRSASVADPRTSKKVAVITGELHPNRTNINAYVRFEEAKSARKALAANGMVVKEHTLRVDLASGNGNYDPKQSVFIGNLKFTVEEEDLRKMFQGCGKILNVRIVRDKITGMGVGIGFVSFDSSTSVELALRLHEEDLMGRPMRVARLKGKEDRSRKKKKERKGALKPGSSNGQIVNGIQGNSVKRKEKKKKPSAEQTISVSSEFQGEKNEKKKKKRKKQNKGELKKKIMLGKLGIIPKSKKNKSQK